MNWQNKKIIDEEEFYLGVDFSNQSFKLVQLEKKNGENHIRGYGAWEIPSECYLEGRIIDKNKVAKLVREAVKQTIPKKINTKKVVCSLPESKVFLRIISIPQMEKEEINEAIKWEIEASIPLSIDQVYYDWRLIGEKDKKQDILTVAVAREVIDDILEIFELAKLEVCVLEPESISITRSLIDKQKSQADESILIVDIGSQMTNFVIAQNGIPFFTSSISFSSEGITNAIAKNLGINNLEAQKIKFAHGLGQFSTESSILNSMQAYLESLSVEIEKSIDFYQNIGIRESKIEKIILCGGGANLKGFLPYLIRRLGRDVGIGDPWVNLNFKTSLPVINKERAIQFSIAIGLASFKNSNKEINLLPDNKKEAIIQRKKFRTIVSWEILITIIMICFFGFLFGLGSLLNLNFITISFAKNGQIDAVQHTKVQNYQEQFSQINSKLAKISLVDADQLYWSEVFLRLNSAVPEALEITGITTKEFVLSLTGYAKTRDDLLKFKDKLMQDGCFSDVNLPISNLVSKDNVNFQMSLTVIEKCLKK